jgi:hypothetical protein
MIRSQDGSRGGKKRKSENCFTEFKRIRNCNKVLRE